MPAHPALFFSGHRYLFVHRGHHVQIMQREGSYSEGVFESQKVLLFWTYSLYLTWKGEDHHSTDRTRRSVLLGDTLLLLRVSKIAWDYYSSV